MRIRRVASRGVAAILIFVFVATAAPPPYIDRDLMPRYWSFLDQHAGRDRSAVERFRAAVIDSDREVYSAVAGQWLTDDGLKNFVAALDGKESQLRHAEQKFPDRFNDAWLRFRKAVPDLSTGSTVYLLPAPRIAVGGAVRPIGRENAIVFGAEEISRVIDDKSAFDVLVHHEMTHLYHMQVNPEMRQMIAAVYMPPYATGRAKLYQVLWLEGLAAYVSRALNPSATDEQVLLSGSVASDVRARWPRLGAELRAVLGSSKKEDIDAWLFDAGTDPRLPRRAGYYLGMKIAERMSRRMSFASLCRLSGVKLQHEVETTLREMEGEQL